MDLTVAIFLVVYVAMAFGHLPGFKVDRTGAATIGAMLLLATGEISSDAAWAAIDHRTLGLLFGLMVVSAAFVASGFYDWAARRLGALPLGPAALLGVVVGVGGVLSAVLTNDVVVVAMTPLLVSATLARGLNPTPFLLGFCFAANAGAAGTAIGSPQNMVAAEALHVSFNGVLAAAAVPALLALPIVWATVAWRYRGRWRLGATAAAPTPPPAVPVDHRETLKAAVVTAGVVAAFVLTDWPRDVVALTGAGVMLLNRRIASTDMLRHVDGDLLLLLIGLFIVNAAFAATGAPQALLAGLRGWGIDLDAPLALYAVAAALSTVVGNTPAVMLLAPLLDPGPGAGEALAAAFALGTGFSSNAVVFGSLAGIIAVEQAARAGVRIGFAEFTRAGLPTALATMALGAAWLWWIG